MHKIPKFPINEILHYENHSKGKKTQPHIYVYIYKVIQHTYEIKNCIIIIKLNTLGIFFLLTHVP